MIIHGLYILVIKFTGNINSLSLSLTLDSRALLFSRACLKKRLPKGRESYDVSRVGAMIPSATNKISSKKREKISPGAEGALSLAVVGTRPLQSCFSIITMKFLFVIIFRQNISISLFIVMLSRNNVKR